MPVNGRGLTQLADNCFVHAATVGGQPSAQRLVGRIFRQDTGGRGNPPPCLSGFDTSGTPFALGHVMALELGGADIEANIVPQYGQWQGNQLGAWRRMEIAVGNAHVDADVFLCEISYDAGPFPLTYIDQATAFSTVGGGAKLFHWREARIPVRFRVWTLALGWNAGTVKIADYLAANDVTKDNSVGALFAALPEARLVFDATIDTMPDIDRQYWRKQMLNSYLRKEHGRYTGKVKAEAQLVRLANQKLLGEGGSRKSSRLGVKLDTRIKKEPVPMDLAKWLQDDAAMNKLLTKLKDVSNPVSATTGWTGVELNGLDLAELRAAIFQT